MNLAHSSSQSDFSSSRFLCSFMQALCGTVKMNTKFSWIGMEVAFLATFAFWSFFVLYCCCFAWGGVPCFKIWWNNKTVSWILTAEGQHTTSVHLCVVWLSAAMLKKKYRAQAASQLLLFCLYEIVPCGETLLRDCCPLANGGCSVCGRAG